MPAGSGVVDGHRVFNIARAQYSLGPSNYVGAVAADMSLADGYNRVVGADLRWRLGAAQRLDAFALASRTRAPDGRFDRARIRAFGNVQLLRWLFLEGNVSAGRAVFYDPIDPFQGRSRSVSAGFRLQPNGRLSQSLFFNRVAFDRESTGAHVYTVNILNARTTYQFTRAFSLRGIAQYDNSRHRILADFLTSFEPRPGTVVYAGYGSVLERREFVDGQWVQGEGTFDASRRGLFFKTSYLFRF